MIHKYELANDWVVTKEYKERTLAINRALDDKRWSQWTRDLKDLQVGAPVSIHNHLNKWDKNGIVLEKKPHSQVVIRVDGSHESQPEIENL